MDHTIRKQIDVDQQARRFCSCPLWVISRHVQCKKTCPLYPRKRTFRVQRKKLDSTKTRTETTIAAANASPIILPSCSGHPVFGSKYSIICCPATSKVSFSRTLAINFKIPNGYRNNSYRNEPTYLSPGHSTKPSVPRRVSQQSNLLS